MMGHVMPGYCPTFCFIPKLLQLCVLRKIFEVNTIASIWRKNMLSFPSCVFLKHSSQKTVHFTEHIIFADKYLSIFSCQIEAIVYVTDHCIQLIHLLNKFTEPFRVYHSLKFRLRAPYKDSYVLYSF